MDYSAAAAGDAAQQQQQQYYQQYPQYQQAPYDPAQSQPYAAYYDPAAYQPYYAAAAPPQPDPQYAGPGSGATGDGMNPAAAAAVAALSQLTQFAGSMDAAERAAAERGHQFPMRAPVGGRSPYRGGGRRGGSVRGRRGGRGNFGQNSTRQDGAPPPFRGRGRGRMGRGGGRHSHQSAPDTGPAGVVQSSYASQPAQAVQTAPKPPQPKIAVVAWCDICRADCNSLEILEQHKNGKRHKKTVKKLEEMQAQQRLMGELPVAVILSPELAPQSNKPPVPVIGTSNLSVASETPAASVITAGVFEPNKVPAVSVNMPTSVPVTAPLAQNQTVAAEPTKAELIETAGAVPLETAAAEAQPTDGGYVSKPGMDGNDKFDRRPGLKRKLTKFGRGGKRLKSYEPVRKPIEPPRFCATCNVMCDTQAVFECHLSGRKHVTRVKRFQRPGLVFGPLSVYIPPNQPTASKGPEPVCYGLRREDMLQIEAAALNDLPLVFSGPQQGDQALGAIETGGAAVVIPPEQGSKRSEDVVLPPAGGEEDAPAAVAKGDVSLDAKGQEAVNAFLSEVDMLNVVPSTTAAEVDMLDVAPSTNVAPSTTAAEVDMLDVAPSTTASEAIPILGNGAPLSDNVTPSGLEVEEDPEEDPEEPTANEEPETAVPAEIP